MHARKSRAASTYFALVALWAGPACAADLTIALPDAPHVSRQIIRYQCGAGAGVLGLPRSPFPVTYLNAGENSLALLPVDGKSLIFVNVFAGSGARYAHGAYIWWDAAGRGASFTRRIPFFANRLLPPAWGLSLQ
jgi:membrane-bound inhibitor of C-type lysozyme